MTSEHVTIRRQIVIEVRAISKGQHLTSIVLDDEYGLASAGSRWTVDNEEIAIVPVAQAIWEAGVAAGRGASK